MSEYFRRASFAIRQAAYVSTIRCFFIFYILVGLPNGFQSRYLPVYFRTHGMSLARVGLFRLLVLPWLMKGLWATYIKRDTDVRAWLKISLLMLTLLCVVAAQIPVTATMPLVVILFSFNAITSVQDTAVDTLLMDAFTPAQLLMGNVAQAVGERVGSIISGGVFTWYIDELDWPTVNYIMGALYGVGVLTSYFLLPEMPPPRASRVALDFSHHDDHLALSKIPIIGTLKKFYRETSSWLIVFVLFYKIGEVGVFSLYPLFLVDRGIEASRIGFWVGLVGQTVSIAGSTATAFFTFSCIITPLSAMLVMRAVLVGVTWLAVLSEHTHPELSFACGVLSIILISVLGGAISTCTQTLLMQLSQRAPYHERAKHYAIYSFGELLAKLLFSAGVGALAQITSYEFAFGLFVLAASAMVPYVWLAPPTVVIPMTY